MMDTLHEDQCIFFITSNSIILKMRTIACKICIENANTHFIINNALSLIVPFMR